MNLTAMRDTKINVKKVDPFCNIGRADTEGYWTLYPVNLRRSVILYSYLNGRRIFLFITFFLDVPQRWTATYFYRN